MYRLFTIPLLLIVFTGFSQTKKPTSTKKPALKKTITGYSDIRTLTADEILGHIVNKRFFSTEGNPSWELRLYGNGTFDLFFENEKKDEYSSILKMYLNNGYHYKKIVKGTFRVRPVDVKQMGRGLVDQPVVDNFGVVQPIFIYVKYYVIFRGEDNDGKSYEICCRLFQEFDHDKRNQWYLGFTNTIEGCNCSTGNGKNRDVWVPGFYIN